MVKKTLNRIFKTDKQRRLYAQEKAIIDVAEIVRAAMDQRGINSQDLAKRARLSKGRISQILSGEVNMTLRTIADVLFALEHDLVIDSKPAEDEDDSTVEYVCTEGRWENKFEDSPGYIWERVAA